MKKLNKTVLVADDDPDIRLYLETLLKDNGFDVLLAENGEEATNLAINNSPDIISLDVSMPEKSGSRAFKELQDHEKTKHIPLMLVTGVDHVYKKFIHTRRTVKPPAAYIEKPVKPQEYLRIICELLGIELLSDIN